MTKGEQRFQNLVLAALFPKGIPEGHREKVNASGGLTQLHNMHEACRAVALESGMELKDDIDEPAEP